MSCSIFKVPDVGRGRGANGHTRVESRRDVTGQCADVCGEHRCGIFVPGRRISGSMRLARHRPCFTDIRFAPGNPCPFSHHPVGTFLLFRPADADFLDRPGGAAMHSKSVAIVFDMCALGGMLPVLCKMKPASVE